MGGYYGVAGRFPVTRNGVCQMLLDRARCEALEAESSIEHLTDECHALRGDL